jgi:hypothetical protein
MHLRVIIIIIKIIVDTKKNQESCHMKLRDECMHVMDFNNIEMKL